MNKYQHFSDEARKRRQRERTCDNKKRYKTEEEAFQKGQRTYECPYCQGFHRSGQFVRFVKKVQNIAKR